MIKNKKQQKLRVQICAILFVAGLVGDYFISYLIHRLLRGFPEETKHFVLYRPLNSLLNDSVHRQLFFVILLFVAIGVLLYYVRWSSSVLDSDTYFVTPDIRKPVAAGQGQHGTQKFDNMHEAYKYITIDRSNKNIAELINTGSDDMNATSNGILEIYHGLENSVFEVLQHDKIICEIITDQDGKASCSLPEGKYKLINKTIENPQYAVAKDTLIDITSKDTIQYEVKALLLTAEIVFYTDKDNDTKFFDIYNFTDGEEQEWEKLKTIIINQNTAKTTLPFGSYFIKEKSDFAEDGIRFYFDVISTESITVYITEDFVLGSLTVSYKTADGEVIEDSGFYIYKQNGEFVIDISPDGVSSIELPEGNYYIEMVDPGEGYKADKNKHKFTISKGNTVCNLEFIAVNAISSIEVIKDNKEKREFSVYKDNSVIDTFTVTNHGKSRELTLGTYNLVENDSGNVLTVKLDSESSTIIDLRSSENNSAQIKSDEKERMKVEKNLVPFGGITLGLQTKGSIKRHKNGRIKSKDIKSENIYCVEEDAHSIVIGSTRCGKTRTMVLETIGVLGLAGESMVISDPKGELQQYTADYLRKLSYKVVIMDFKTPRKSDCYNNLQRIINAVNDNDMDKAIDETWDITASLVGSEQVGEKLWQNGEAAVIASSILAVVIENKNRPEYQNLTNVYYFLANMCEAPENPDEEILLSKFMEDLETKHPAKALLAMAKVAPSRTRGSFFTSALMTLKLFTSPSMYYITSHSEFSLEDIGKDKIALFLVLPDHKKTYHSIASLFINQQYAALAELSDKRGGRLERRVNFILDEFGNFTKIPDFDAKLSVGGGRGMRFNMFLQSYGQLDLVYGKDLAKTILDNVHYTFYLKATDYESRKKISDSLGNYTVSTSSKSINKSGTNETIINSSGESANLTSCPLLDPAELGKIQRPYTVVTNNVVHAVCYAPDIAEWYFNEMFGLGNEEHNRLLRENRENRRVIKATKEELDIKLWGIWNKYRRNSELAAAGFRPISIK